MIELNLFKSIPPSQDENVLRQERYTTRIYLILLLLTVMILTLFTSIKPQTIRVIIKSPLLKDFIQLYDQYPLTLDCPCSQPAIDKQFISHIKPQYHEVCLSEFVSSNWINVQFYQQPSLTDTPGDVYQLCSQMTFVISLNSIFNFYQHYVTWLIKQFKTPFNHSIELSLLLVKCLVLNHFKHK